jgi:hypothetical protein
LVTVKSRGAGWIEGTEGAGQTAVVAVLGEGEPAASRAEAHEENGVGPSELKVPPESVGDPDVPRKSAAETEGFSLRVGLVSAMIAICCVGCCGSG